MHHGQVCTQSAQCSTPHQVSSYTASRAMSEACDGSNCSLTRGSVQTRWLQGAETWQAPDLLTQTAVSIQRQ